MTDSGSPKDSQSLPTAAGDQSPLSQAIAKHPLPESPSEQSLEGVKIDNMNGVEYESQQLTLELEMVKKERMMLAMELNKLRAEDRVRGQLPDNELIDQAKNLRREIKNFCIQYFDDNVLEMQNLGTDRDYFRHLQSTTREKNSYRAYLHNPNRRAQIVTAFLWRVLACEIFDIFHWAGDKLAQSLKELKEILAPENALETFLGNEELAFQKWQAKTIESLLDAMRDRASEAQEAKDDVEQLKSRVVRNILQTLGQEKSPESEDMAAQLDNILDLALALDEVISQQLVRVEWRYDYEGLVRRKFNFDKAEMEVDKNDCISLANQRRVGRKRTLKVQMVVEPSLVKRSGRDGEDADLGPTTLMKMFVVL